MSLLFSKRQQFSGVVFLFLLAVMQHAAWAALPAEKEYREAEKFFAAKKYGDAVPLYEKALQAPPEGVSAADVHMRIADAHFQMGDFENALSSYRAALPGARPSARPMTQYWIGFCCFLTGRDAEAVSELLKIPELYPGSGMLVSTAYYWAGRASERMGKKEQASEFYRKAGGSGSSVQARYAKKRAEAVKDH